MRFDRFPARPFPDPTSNPEDFRRPCSKASAAASRPKGETLAFCSVVVNLGSSVDFWGTGFLNANLRFGADAERAACTFWVKVLTA